MEILVESAALEEFEDEVVGELDSDVDADEMIDVKFAPAYEPVETDVENMEGVDIAEVIDEPKPPFKNISRVSK